MLVAENLSLIYQDGGHDLRAIDDISLSIEDRHFVGILGPSGSGKSSLLYLLSGLRKPTEGEIFHDDRAYGRMSENERAALRRSEFGFVFQQHFLINYLTVIENVMLGSASQGAAQRRLAGALLEELGLAGKQDRLPHELSGGERQRVAVARAVIHRPRIIFADEPTGLLDRRNSMEVVSLLKSRSKNSSLIAVTHNPEILQDADLIIHLRDGQIVRMEDRVTRAGTQGTVSDG